MTPKKNHTVEVSISANSLELSGDRLVATRLNGFSLYVDENFPQHQTNILIALA